MGQAILYRRNEGLTLRGRVATIDNGGDRLLDRSKIEMHEIDFDVIVHAVFLDRTGRRQVRIATPFDQAGEHGEICPRALWRRERPEHADLYI